jgi:peroxiredoxin
MPKNEDWRRRQAGKAEAFTIFLVVACAVLAVLVVLLARQNMKLKEEIGTMTGAVPVEDALKPGDSLTAMTLLDEGGEKVVLDFGGENGRTVLLVFSVHCPACEKTLPVWSDMFAGEPPPGVRILGIQLDMPDEEGGLLTPSLSFPVYGIERSEADPLKKVPYIPATMILDANGVIEEVWFGILSEENQEEIRQAL